MKKRLLSFGLIGIFLIALVSAAIYQEPWIQNQLGDQHNLSDMDWIFANHFSGDFNGTITNTGNMDMGDYNITGISYLIFTLGETIDNLVNGWVRITGSLDVTGDANVTGSLNVTENVTTANLLTTENVYVGTGTEWLSIYLSGSTGYFDSTYPIEFTDNVTAPYFFGNGSQLTDITDTNTWDTSWLANYSAYNSSWSPDGYEADTDTFVGNWSDYLNKVGWGDVGNGTIFSSDTTPQLGGYLDTNAQNIGATDDEIENIYVGLNTRIYFGDGQETSIYYNGTCLILG